MLIPGFGGSSPPEQRRDQPPGHRGGLPRPSMLESSGPLEQRGHDRGRGRERCYAGLEVRLNTIARAIAAPGNVTAQSAAT
jgi:hypothetical protein